MLPASTAEAQKNPTFANPKGMYEDREFQRTDERILREAGAPEWWYDIPDPNSILEVGKDPRYIEHIKRLVASRVEVNTIWGIKDPRLCATYPIIRPHLPNPHVIFCGREADESIQSVRRVFSEVEYTKMIGMPSQPYSFWGTVIARCMDHLFSLPDPLLVLSFEDIMQNPTQVAKRVAKFIGVKYTEEAGDWIDPGLRNFNNEEE